MPRKTFNSETARKLAQQNKIKLGDIPTTRQDNKITIQNIKDYLKSIKRTKPAVSPRTRKTSPVRRTTPNVSPRTRKISPIRRTTQNVESIKSMSKPTGIYYERRQIYFQDLIDKFSIEKTPNSHETLPINEVFSEYYIDNMVPYTSNIQLPDSVRDKLNKYYEEHSIDV